MLDAKGANLIRKGSADEIVAHRDRALEHYRLGLQYLASAMAAHKLARQGDHAAAAELNRINWYGGLEHGGIEKEVEKIRIRLDGDVWEHMLGALGMKNLMDAKAIAEFRDQNSKAPPPVTHDNLAATFGRLNEDRHEIFERGVINLFTRLDRSFVTNKAYRLDKKLVMTSVLSTTSCGGWNHWNDGSDRLRDLDRIFHVLDGKAPKDHCGDAAAVVGSVRNLPNTTQTDYFDFKLCKNSNLHMTFRRPDLVREVNRIIARHFGDVLAHERPRRRAA